MMVSTRLIPDFKTSFCLGLLLLLTFSAGAQLRLQQLPRTVHTKKNATARTQADPLQLPFFDDFSFTPVIDGVSNSGGAVLLSLWDTASYSAYVNPGSGVNAPSRNVATLDGQNRTGDRYSEQQLNNGFADTLVSRPIDLSILTVALPERESVYLSFFYQRGGFAEIPDAKDFLQLEFLNVDGAWELIQQYRPTDAPDRDKFYIALVKVEGDRFFHAEFQFRIRNFGRLSGPFDAWNIDYVYLNKGRTDDMDIADQAPTRQISPMFGPYYSMPLDHFRDSSHVESVSTGVYSLWATFRPTTDFSAKALFHNVMEDESIVTHPVLFADADPVRPGGGESARLFQFEHLTFSVDSLPDPHNPLQFHPDAKRIDIDYEISLQRKETTDRNDQYLIFQLNDTTRTRYHLDDYYAYDDGSAEYAAVLTNPGVRVAYAFDMIRTSDEPDFISGFEVHFPKWAKGQNLAPAFFIYDDNNGEPGEILWSISSLPISQLGPNEFQMVPVYESVPVTKRFYIGWEAPVGGLVGIGVDFNNDTGDKIMYKANGVWNVNDAVLGSLMIRPHFGEGVFTEVPEDLNALNIYPNPNRGTFYIQDVVSVVDVISISGQRIPFTFLWEEGQTRIALRDAAPGMYILRTQKGTRVHAQKVVVSDN